jgi:2-polyprenyl-6-methoxyphenol hydroxylase-like FAD-dependent oxidoreductase
MLLWSNATRTLAQLGVDVVSLGAVIEHTEVRTAVGDLLCRLPIGDWSARAGAPSIAIRRPLLVDALARSLPDDVVETGHTVAGFSRDRSGVALHLENERRYFDAVIGADGLSSVIRRQLLGDQPIRVVQQRGWVGLSRPQVPLLQPGCTTATIGHGPRFWSAPLPDGAAFWFATLDRAAPTSDDVLGFLRSGFAGWPAPIDEILAATHPADIVLARICDRPPSARWGEGPVTLLGDAAHPATPDLGQGACQAIESAATLAQCLVDADAIEAGLRAYEDARMERTATISRLCWITSLNTTIESSLLCTIRDTGIKLGLPMIARRHMQWILGSAA